MLKNRDMLRLIVRLLVRLWKVGMEKRVLPLVPFPELFQQIV
ncbi:hypothetical protein O0535_03850 [Brevibacillus halotolerans]|uniref:Uncharacterized protein n=1 Tax=Brevibacillus halotolerans TaxID=1507437 RepID=A0ABT4HT26_9BACL|nr:hypothetical protein [Brevibacillus halotolerans]